MWKNGASQAISTHNVDQHPITPLCVYKQIMTYFSNHFDRWHWEVKILKKSVFVEKWAFTTYP